MMEDEIATGLGRKKKSCMRKIPAGESFRLSLAFLTPGSPGLTCRDGGSEDWACHETFNES